MASVNTSSIGNVNGSDDIHLEGSPVMANPWTHNIQRQIARLDQVLSHSSDSDSPPPMVIVSLRLGIPRSKRTLPISIRTHRFAARQAGRERSPTVDSVIAQPGSPRRQVADDGEAVAAGTNGCQTLQELALDYGADARNILHGMDTDSSQGPRPSLAVILVVVRDQFLLLMEFMLLSVLGLGGVYEYYLMDTSSQP
ncbi:hypothetical protein BGX38DRAFT_1145035 [Terfezia claveryi]|nr:hypothetical protein BGX38DRAFT_1145035 [Terfezia claveryi]